MAAAGYGVAAGLDDDLPEELPGRVVEGLPGQWQSLESLGSRDGASGVDDVSEATASEVEDGDAGGKSEWDWLSEETGDDRASPPALQLTGSKRRDTSKAAAAGRRYSSVRERANSRENPKAVVEGGRTAVLDLAIDWCDARLHGCCKESGCISRVAK